MFVSIFAAPGLGVQICIFNAVLNFLVRNSVGYFESEEFSDQKLPNSVAIFNLSVMSSS